MVRMADFLGQLQTTTTLEQIQTLVTDLRDSQNLEHVIYHIVGDTGREYGALTYDPDWVQHYISNRYFRIDPVVSQALRSFGPLDWRTLDWSGQDARRLLGEAVDEGVGKQGLSVPVRGPSGQFALFTVTSYANDTSWDSFQRERTGELILAAHYIHDRASQIMGTAAPVRPTELSPRERDVLSLLSIGQSRTQVADKLRISEHTIKAYLDSARAKLGAMNATHAVSLALHQGLIFP